MDLKLKHLMILLMLYNLLEQIFMIINFFDIKMPKMYNFNYILNIRSNQFRRGKNWQRLFYSKTIDTIIEYLILKLEYRDI
jgi:hypothetical protein